MPFIGFTTNTTYCNTDMQSTTWLTSYIAAFKVVCQNLSLACVIHERVHACLGFFFPEIFKVLTSDSAQIKLKIDGIAAQMSSMSTTVLRGCIYIQCV